MKVKAEALFKIVREVVRDEIKKSLPMIMREVLTEQYLKRLVSENTSSTLRNVFEEAEVEEEDLTPTPPKNSHPGIYANKTQQRESVASLLAAKKHPLVAKENPMKFLYEDISHEETPVTDVDLGSLGLDPNKMKALANVPSRPSVTSNESYEEKMRQLEERRKALDVPAPISR